MCLYMYEVLFLFPLQFFWFGLKMYPEKFEKEEIINICKECPDDIWHLDFYCSILVCGQSNMMGTDYKPHVENKLIQLSLG